MQQYDVFISYATRDYMYDDGRIIPGNVITQIQKTLRDNGISYWIDKEGLLCGDEFPVTIAEQIRNAKVFLFVSSQNANQSDWTLNEIATARNYGKRIIPFRYDNTPYDTSIMIYVAGLQYVSFQDNPEKAMSDLVVAIHRAMGKEDLPMEHTNFHPWKFKFQRWFKKFWWLFSLLILLVLGGVGHSVYLSHKNESSRIQQVYITPKGHRYHTNPDCRFLHNRQVTEISIEKASELRLLPCLECSRREDMIMGR